MACEALLTLEMKELTWDESIQDWVRFIKVPCGKCFECKKNRVMQWSFRLLEELKVSTSAYFITLTYDTKNVPINNYGNMTLVKTAKQSRELPENKKLSKKDQKDYSHQGFMKRLRYYEEKDIKNNKISLDRYYKLKTRGILAVENKPLKMFICGEYGEKRHRPHLHGIIYNVNDQENIKLAWTFGGVHIDEVNEATVNYVLKYMMKEQSDYTRGKRVQKEFHIMSKGLGLNYVNYGKMDQRQEHINYVVDKKGIKIPTPRYYKDKIYPVRKWDKESGREIFSNENKEIKNKKAAYMDEEALKRKDEEKRLCEKYGISVEELRVRKIVNSYNRFKNPLKKRDYD